MKSKSITCVIRTLGRDSIYGAINSAVQEFEKTIVVIDRDAKYFDRTPQPGLSHVKCGNKFEQFNGTAVNVAATLATTPYITLLDDDDEFFNGAGEIMEQKVTENPEIDIWIPGLMYNDGGVVCASPGLWGGNVAVPTYKVGVFWEVPFTKQSIKDAGGLTDFYHVQSCSEHGFTVGWYESLLYAVRPKLPGRGGGGHL